MEQAYVEQTGTENPAYLPDSNSTINHLSPNDDHRKSSSVPVLPDLHNKQNPNEMEIASYPSRWFMLIISFIHAAVVSFQWAMYTIIADITTKYYGVSDRAVDLTLMMYFIGYFVGFLPASWILNTLGLRWTVLIGAGGNALGCLLRVFSAQRNLFWLTMLGQTIVAFAQAVVPIVPARLAAVWFPAHQVSSACSVAFNGMLVGTAIGFLVPPLVVRNSDDLEQVGSDFRLLFIGVAVASFVALALVILFFKDEPELPPSPAQWIQRMGLKTKEKSVGSGRDFIDNVKRLLTSVPYDLLLVAFSLNVGVFGAISAKLNKILLPYFPEGQAEIGAVGLVLIISGLIASIACGYILDKTHAFKATTMALCVLSLIGWIAFVLVDKTGEIAWVFAATVVLGIATTAIQPVGIEFSVEITFPEPEGISSGIIFGVMQVSSIISVLAFDLMIDAWGAETASWAMCTPFAIACLLVLFMRPKLKRQAAQKQKCLQQGEAQEAQKQESLQRGEA